MGKKGISRVIKDILGIIVVFFLIGIIGCIVGNNEDSLTTSMTYPTTSSLIYKGNSNLTIEDVEIELGIKLVDKNSTIFDKYKPDISFINKDMWPLVIFMFFSLSIPYTLFILIRGYISRKHNALIIYKEAEIISENGVSYITGRIKNKSKKTHLDVQVKINLYDKDKTLIGNISDSVNNLGPHEVWTFKVLTSQDNSSIAFCKIVDITK